MAAEVAERAAAVAAMDGVAAEAVAAGGGETTAEGLAAVVATATAMAAVARRPEASEAVVSEAVEAAGRENAEAEAVALAMAAAVASRLRLQETNPASRACRPRGARRAETGQPMQQRGCRRQWSHPQQYGHHNHTSSSVAK